MTSSQGSLGLLVLLAAHLVWGATRLPSKVIARRWHNVADYRRQGDAAFLFADAQLAGANEVQWLRTNTDEQAVVLWQGQETGPIEFAAAQLWPRLLVAADRVGANPTFAGRQVATATRGGTTGTVVLVATPQSLQIEVR